MSHCDTLKQWKAPGCTRFQRADFLHRTMIKARTLEACAPRRFPEESFMSLTAMPGNNEESLGVPPLGGRTLTA
jgi:hypothetical protein